MRVENQVNVICQVMKFYFQRLQLIWLENGNVFWIEMVLVFLENKDGIYNWMSWFLVNVFVYRDDVKFICQVEYDGQLVVNKSFFVKVLVYLKEQGLNIVVENIGINEWNIYIVVGVVCILLVVLLMVVFYFV